MTADRAALVAVTVAGLAGCAHAPGSATPEASARLRCEDAAASAAARAMQVRSEPRSNPGPESRASAGNGDAATAASAAAALGCLLFTPVFALQAAATGDGTATARCSAWRARGPAAPAAGDDGRAADPSRCAMRVALALEVEAVAGCYEARDAPGDRAAGLETLAQLRWDGELWSCLPDAQRGRLEDARMRLLDAPVSAAPRRCPADRAPPPPAP